MKMQNGIKILFTLLVLFAVASANTTDEEVKNTTETPAKKEFIKVSDISEYSVKTDENLQEILKKTSKSKELDEMHSTIPQYIASIETILGDAAYKNLESLNIRKLQQMQSELSVYLTTLVEWKKILKSRVEVYDENREILALESKLWAQTKLNAEKENAPKAIQEQIQSVNKNINELDNSTKLDYDITLTDLSILTKNISIIENMIENLKKNELISSNKVFHKNALDIFTSLSEESVSFKKYFSNVYKVSVENFDEVKSYFETYIEKVYTLLAFSFFIVLFVFYSNYLYLKRKLFVKEESSYKKEFYFITRPLATIIILVVISLIILFPQRPNALMQFILLLVIFPVFRIIQTMLQREHVKYLYTFLFLYFLELAHNNSTGYELEGRLSAITLSIALFAYIFVLLRKRVLEQFVSKFLYNLTSKILALFMILSLIAIASNIYGAVLLAYRINNGIFLAIYTSLIFYSMYIVLTGYIVIIFRRRVSTASHMLDRYSQKIEKVTISLLKIIMFLWWFQIITKILSLYPYIIAFKDDLLALSWTIASTTISVESVVDFIFIIFGTWALSKVVITILTVEVFARFRMPRGMPTAITTTLNYAIVITGTIIALSSLGVTQEQFTLVVGALGVGIGFGLRNIIANFVSGIIMIFERPIQIGDTIELNNTIGSVQSIGTRSSTIKTFDGSEVIIPNADFIAKEITNWTLSDEHRRKTILFKVDFDSDVEQVLAIMQEVTVNHPDVLKEPEPLAVFQGFGENYLEFKVYYWLCDNIIVAQSEIALGIYKALKEAGIKMPMPKQEMYVKNESEEKSL